MSQWKIEVVEREGFWGPRYVAAVREYLAEDKSHRAYWITVAIAKARTPEKAEANARKRIEEIKAERKRKAEVEYTVEIED